MGRRWDYFKENWAGFVIATLFTSISTALMIPWFTSATADLPLWLLAVPIVVLAVIGILVIASPAAKEQRRLNRIIREGNR